MRISDHALLAGGAALSLLAGAATADLGLNPMRHALAAEAPSLDTAVADAEPTPVQADVATDANAVAPAVAAPIRPPGHPHRTDHHRAPTLDEDAGPPVDGEVQDNTDREAKLDFGHAPEDVGDQPERSEQDHEAPDSDTASPAQDPPPVTPG